jgi:hypothetical protein
MEFIIGLVVIWIIWILLTSSSRREERMKDANGEAFLEALMNKN